MWVTVGSLCRQGVNFIIGIYVARMIGIKDFGKLAVIQSTIYMLAELGQAGVGFSATKYVASMRSIDAEKTGRIIGFSFLFTLACALIMGTTLYLFSTDISKAVLPEQDISAEIRFASIWIIFEMINYLQIRVLNGFEAFRNTAIYNLSQAMIQLPLAIWGAYSGGLTGTIVAFSIVSIISCMVGQVLLRKQCNYCNISITYHDVWQERGMLKMSTMVSFCGVAMYATNWLVGIMLAKQPSGLTEFGLFNAASRFQSILLFIPKKIYDVTVPVLANLQSEGNRRAFTKVLMGAGLFTVIVTSTGCLILVFFAEDLMKLYGAEFAMGADILKIIALGAVISAVWTVSTAGLWAAEKSNQMFSLDIIRGSLLLGLCLAGFAINAHDLALAYLYSYSIAILPLLFALYKLVKQPWPTKVIANPNPTIV